jgi:hypothetical protein
MYKIDKSEPTIFTTGAFLRPMKVKDVDGNDLWVWCVTEFVDDNFNDSGNIYNPREVASTKELLTVI